MVSVTLVNGQRPATAAKAAGMGQGGAGERWEECGSDGVGEVGQAWEGVGFVAHAES